MNIGAKKIFKIFSKIFLSLLIVALLAYLGYYLYFYFVVKPRNLRVSNLTDSSFAVSWVTDSPAKGIVYYGEEDRFLPALLAGLGSQKAYDDRDVAKAQRGCIQEFNKQASEAMTDSYVVTLENFNCEDPLVQEESRYYTHHVTITNLDPEKTYYFRVGNRLISSMMEVDSVTTFPQLEQVEQPIPIFGRILDSDETYSEDSIIYATFSNGREAKESILYSGVANEEGGWYLDGSYIRTDTGELVGMKIAQDLFTVSAQYKNYNLSESHEWVFGSFGSAYPDILVQKNGKVESLFFDRFTSKVLAIPTIDDPNLEPQNIAQPESQAQTEVQTQAPVCQFGNYSGCSRQDLINNVNVWGAGNVSRAYANLFNNGVLDSSVLVALGLSNGSSSDAAANLSAISGTGITTADYEKAEEEGKNVYIDVSEGNSIKISDAQEEVVSPPVLEQGSNTITFTVGLSAGSFSEIALNGVPVSEILGDNGLEQLRDYIDENCTPAQIRGNECEIPVEAIELTSFVLLSNYSDEIDSCLEDPDCDPGRTRESYVGETELLIAEANQGMNAALVADAEPLGELIAGMSEACIEGDSVACANVDNVWLELYGTPGADVLSADPEIWKNSIVDAVRNDNCDISCVENLAGVTGYTSPGVEVYKNSPYYNWEEALDQLEQALDNLETRDPSYFGPKEFALKVRDFILGSEVSAQGLGEEDQKVFFLPEYGTYTLEFGPFEYEKEVTDGKTLYLFYFETNDESGFQIDEDYVLKSFASEITYQKTASAKTVSLNRGINILSFDWLPAFDYEQVYTAKDLAAEIDVIEFVAHYEGGRWSKGISCEIGGGCNGTDFSLTPGRGYVIKAREDSEVVLPGYQITSPVPVPFSSGWNLVGVHGYPRAYSARSFIESINRLEGLTSDNVSWWSSSVSRYEGIQVTDGIQYGIDFPINPSNGYFVRISDFQPSQVECKSIIWNEGGDLDGDCGHSKSIF
jgi:hypothetical protein